MTKTFIKTLFLAFFAFFAGNHAIAQYGNEWIRFNQQYFKIPVAKDGLYRLTYADLQNAGFPVSTVDPRRMQIFHRGVEQRIIVQGEQDAVFNPGDYLEFYGRRNDGIGDAELYQPASLQPHQYHNLYSDSSVYFLTVNALAQLGLRMEPFSEINVTNIPAEVFHRDQKLSLLTTQYATGKLYNVYLQNSFFDVGEGWTGNVISENQFIDYIMENIVNTSQASGTPQLEVQVVGRAELPHRVEISVGPSIPTRVVNTTNFSGADVVTLTAPLNWSDIGGDGKITVRVRALGTGGSDRLSASYIKITFPQSFNQGGATEKNFRLEEKVSNKSYIEIQNTPASTRLFDVTDPVNVVPIGTTVTTTLNAVIPNTASSRKILATNAFTTPSVVPVTFRSIDPDLHDYIIISNSALMHAGGGYSNPVKAYGGYRASVEGGSYDTLIVEINQLYNQFNYGEVSPLAVRRFMKFMIDSGDPRYLFLIGKGLDITYNYHRNPSLFTTYHDLVPTAGLPASDILFTAGLDGTEYQPAVPTGRITANTPADVAAYLNKVKEMDALPYSDLWRKDLLHLSGGINDGEPEEFKIFMQQFEAVAESYYLGGLVSSIAKNSTDIEFINISDQVNKGVNLITLFGHSSPSQNDFNIGFVSAPELGYNNKNKYPMLLINGCNAGDFFAPTIRYGEDWINTPEKGAVGFMANASFGYATVLRIYSQSFYSTAYGDSTFIYKGIGDIQKETVRKSTFLNESVPFTTQAQQMILLGDPAVKLFGSNKPDYEINNDHVYTESYNAEPITALSDSFAIKIIVRNFGRAKEDSIAVHIVRTLNDNSTITYDSLFHPVLYSDTLEFTIYKDEQGFGINSFAITLDPFDEISELDKLNNTAVLNMFIPLNAAKNLFPQNFSIVNSSTVKMVVQSTDVLDGARDFVIQLDTVDTFNSSYMQEFTVNGKLATLSATIITMYDTLAFYWRVKLAQPLPDESGDWSTSSFTYIENGPEGWAQVHFPQYMSNVTSGLVRDEENRLLKLQETVTDVAIQTFGADHPAPFTAVSVKLNSSEYNPVSLPELQCRDNTINLIVFDKTTTTPYMPLPVQYPNKKACGRRPEVITSFLSTEVEAATENLIHYINNVAAGDSVILFSIGDPGYASWSVNVRNKLAELGISGAQISGLQPGEPIVVLAKKGTAAGSAVIIKSPTAPADEQELEVEETITGRFVSGTMTSSIIGPATAWQNLYTIATITETPVTDEFSFDVVGITLSGEETLLKSSLIGYAENLSDINAEQYPYLKLVYHAADEINLTAPQLKKWIVAYTPAPEGVLLFTGSQEMQNLLEGESWTGSYAFNNISTKEFADSLIVQYNIYNSTSRISDLRTKKILAPLPGEETAFDLVVNSTNKAGLNDVKVYVNPRVLPEVYYDNNVITFYDYLNVEADKFNPVLDVTIDGRHLTNGDYVSPNPFILIKLWDENTLLPKMDTTGISIVLKYPCPDEDCPFTGIYFTRPDVEWHPATSTTDFEIEFSPQGLPEGLYTLRVEAKDVRNNPSGSEPYEIDFEVVESNSIVIQKPYPNPSSSLFFFNVVVTGDNQPDDMRLEIINVNGQVVEQYSGTNFFTGTNRIPLDAAHLPNGLYHYRLILLRGGAELKQASGKLMLVK